MEPTASIFYSKHGLKKEYTHPWFQRQQRQIKNVVAVANTHQSAYYQIMKPLIFCLRLTGGFPFTFHKDTLQFKLCSWWSLYSGIFACIQIGDMALSAHIQFYGGNSFFDNNLFSTSTVVITTLQALAPITLWAELPFFLRYFSKWQAYQKELHARNVILNTKLKKWSYVFLLLCALYVYSTNYFHPAHQRRFMPGLLLIQINFFISLGLWLFSALFIQATSSHLLTHITKLAENHQVHKIAVCRNLWLNLANLTVELGNILGMTVIIYLILSNAVLIISLYSLIFIFHEKIKDGSFDQHYDETKNFHSKIFFFILATILVIFPCEFGHRYSSTVGSKMQSELLRLSFTLQDRECRLQVNHFIQTISFNYPHLTLCGFVTLNRTLLVSIVSSGITYLLVLVQFRSTENKKIHPVAELHSRNISGYNY